MKTLLTLIVGACLVGGSGVVSATDAGNDSLNLDWLQISTNRQAFATELDKIEQLWPGQPEQYFETAKQLENGLEHFTEILSARQSMVDLFTNVALKAFPSDPGLAATFVERERDFILESLNFETMRKEKATYQAMAHLLGEIRSQEIPNYVPRGTSRPGLDILIQAGVMDPKQITDPNLTQQLADAEAANKRDLVMNTLQASLAASDRILSFHLLHARFWTRANPAIDGQFVNAVTIEGHLTPEERHQIAN